MAKRKKRTNLVIILSLVLSLAGLFLLLLLRTKAEAPLAISNESTSVPAAAEAPALDPLTIEAIRARTYTASPIVAEQNLGDQGGYTTKIVSFKSDGFKVYALAATPSGTKPAAGWPVIILDHGYINPATYKTNDGSYQTYLAGFTNAGFMVIKPDYRGHGKSEGTPEGGHFSPVYAYDNLNLIASLKQYNEVNGARIGLFGHSLGGHVALRTIVATKEVKATVLMAGVVGSFNDIFYNWPHSPMPFDQPGALLRGKKQALINKYGEPKTNPTFWDSVSAINYIDYVAGSVQINHDEGDSVVPKLFSDHLSSALTKAGKNVTYYTYPGDDHQFSKNRTLFLARAVAFYKANL